MVVAFFCTLLLRSLQSKVQKCKMHYSIHITIRYSLSLFTMGTSYNVEEDVFVCIVQSDTERKAPSARARQIASRRSSPMSHDRRDVIRHTLLYTPLLTAEGTALLTVQPCQPARRFSSRHSYSDTAFDTQSNDFCILARSMRVWRKPSSQTCRRCDLQARLSRCRASRPRRPWWRFCTANKSSNSPPRYRRSRASSTASFRQ